MQNSQEAERDSITVKEINEASHVASEGAELVGDRSTGIQPDEVVDRVVAYFTSNVKNQHDVAEELGNYLVQNPITTEASIEIWKALETKGRLWIKE